MRDIVAEMVRDFLTDKEIMTEKKRAQITKALEINEHLTSTYALQVEEVQDILGKDSKTSGWYIILEGTRSRVTVFINNEMEITRKPRNSKTVKSYYYYNDNMFHEGFWTENF